MIFCCFVVNIIENINYAAGPQSLTLSHGSRKDRTTYFDFLTEHNKLDLSHMREPSLQGNLEHQPMRLSNQENHPKKKRSSAKHQGKRLDSEGNSPVKKLLWLSAKS